jgi:hypothetical protein
MLTFSFNTIAEGVISGIVLLVLSPLFEKVYTLFKQPLLKLVSARTYTVSIIGLIASFITPISGVIIASMCLIFILKKMKLANFQAVNTRILILIYLTILISLVNVCFGIYLFYSSRINKTVNFNVDTSIKSRMFSIHNTKINAELGTWPEKTFAKNNDTIMFMIYYKLSEPVENLKMRLYFESRKDELMCFMKIYDTDSKEMDFRVCSIQIPDEYVKKRYLIPHDNPILKVPQPSIPNTSTFEDVQYERLHHKLDRFDIIEYTWNECRNPFNNKLLPIDSDIVQLFNSGLSLGKIDNTENDLCGWLTVTTVLRAYY